MMNHVSCSFFIILSPAYHFRVSYTLMKSWFLSLEYIHPLLFSSSKNYFISSLACHKPVLPLLFLPCVCTMVDQFRGIRQTISWICSSKASPVYYRGGKEREEERRKEKKRMNKEGNEYKEREERKEMNKEGKKKGEKEERGRNE